MLQLFNYKGRIAPYVVVEKQHELGLFEQSRYALWHKGDEVGFTWDFGFKRALTTFRRRKFIYNSTKVSYVTYY